MATLGKKIAIGGVLATGLALLFFKKVTNLQYAFSKMAIGQYGIPRNIEIHAPFSADGYIRFTTDVALKNNSEEDFNLSGNIIATLTRLAFIYEGTTIGSANVNITEISVPAYGEKIIPNIPVEVSAKNLFSNISNIPAMINKFSIIGYVNVLGTEYMIGS